MVTRVRTRWTLALLFVLGLGVPALAGDYSHGQGQNKSQQQGQGQVQQDPSAWSDESGSASGVTQSQSGSQAVPQAQSDDPDIIEEDNEGNEFSRRPSPGVAEQQPLQDEDSLRSGATLDDQQASEDFDAQPEQDEFQSGTSQDPDEMAVEDEMPSDMTRELDEQEGTVSGVTEQEQSRAQQQQMQRQQSQQGQMGQQPMDRSQSQAAEMGAGDESLQATAPAAETRGQARQRRFPEGFIHVIPTAGASSFTTGNEVDFDNFDDGFTAGVLVDFGSNTWAFETGVLAFNTQGNPDPDIEGSTSFDVDNWGIPLLAKVNFSGHPNSTIYAKAGAMPFQPDGTSDDFNILAVGALGGAIPLVRNTALTLEASYNRLFDEDEELGDYQGVSVLAGISFGI